jgi:hypothetical protein
VRRKWCQKLRQSEMLRKTGSAVKAEATLAPQVPVSEYGSGSWR